MATLLFYLSVASCFCFGWAEIFSRHSFSVFNLNKTFTIESIGVRFGLECVARCAQDPECFGSEWNDPICRLANRGVHPILTGTVIDSAVYLRKNYTEYLAALHSEQFGGSGGEYFTDENQYLQFGNLNAIWISVDKTAIRGVTATYGSHKGPKHGLISGTNSTDYTLQPGELVQSVTVREYSCCVFAIQLHTSVGRQSDMMGVAEGDTKTCDLSPRCLGFIAGRFEYAFDGLYFYTVPC
ncbi:hypothetical protein CAPTEDRAFT_208976 [Capitella teleta]|uniref:Jacalin-type lectin domain-containing protein n=1 Tax=Capitella teleta TaxID=283909 RepID=R7VJL7_CAPTE|nr:hypothetical protein CAPTEDRAFT_208976 [Capitella teleta]|eukprot:ELU16591.1 hypothetical protein CAPTEDRAFT_208976 [Capitella teleta]